MLIVEVTVKPGSTRPGIVHENGILTVRVRERAIEGAANAACVRALAAAYGVPPSRVRLIGGARSRHKRFAVSVEEGGRSNDKA